MRLPAALSGQIEIAGRDFPDLPQLPDRLRRGRWSPRCGSLLERTRFGAQVRAAVDNLRMAQSIGINTSRLFAITFALGSGLAALGGALGAEILSIDPSYALENLVYFLIVVAVGGLGSIRGPFFAALLVGIADTAFKYLAARARRVLHLCARRWRCCCGGRAACSGRPDGYGLR